MSRRLTLLTSAVVALSLLTGTACSGDDDGDAGKAEPARGSLQSLLLDPTDLPEVYSSGEVLEGAKDTCGGTAVDIGEPEDTASVAYIAADDGNTLHETISEYAPGDAAALLAAVRASPEACVGDDEVALDVEPLDLPVLLDDSVAVVAAGQVGDQTLTLHQVFVRDGDTVIVVVHGGTAPVDAAATEELARRAAEKVSPPEG